MPGDFFFLNYGVQDGNVMQGLFRVNKVTYQLEVYNGSQWVVVNVEGDATATPLTTVQRMAYAPASGALIWDVDEELLYVGDGLTTGGVPFGSAAVSMTSAQREAITPRAGQLIWDTTVGALFIGDGSTAGGINTSTNLVRGATNGVIIEDGIAKADTATVEEVLTGSTGFVNVDTDNLRGALSVGQAVDVSCPPGWASSNMLSYAYLSEKESDGTWSDWTPLSSSTAWKAIQYLKDFKIKFTANASTGSWYFGWTDTPDGSQRNFPKAAPGLNYLVMAEVTPTGAALASNSFVTGTGVLGSASTYIGTGVNVTYKLAITKEMMTRWTVNFNVTVGASYEFEFSNWRQYEVTALTDEAIAYIAQLEDPDVFFRSTSAYSIRNKYLIKQDMVCPFIPTINMPDNSDLTVAAGLSYKIKYTDDNTHTITADTIPTDAYGWDTHIQMFIKGTSAINFQKPLVLMDALTPNAGHNLSVKWRNGDALVYVDDTNAGYIVTVSSGTATGSLYDAISNDYTDYVIFAAGLDGTTIDAGDATFSGGTGINAVNVLGNGTDNTIITGNISATSGNTINFQSLTIDGGTFGGEGTMNLDDVVINTSALFDMQVRSPSMVINGTYTGSIAFGYTNSNISGSGVLDGADTYTITTSDTNTVTNVIENVTFSNYKSTITLSGSKQSWMLNNVTINAIKGVTSLSISGANVEIDGLTITGSTSSSSQGALSISGANVVANNIVITDANTTSIRVLPSRTSRIQLSNLTLNKQINIYKSTGYGTVIIAGSSNTIASIRTLSDWFAYVPLLVLSSDTLITFTGDYVLLNTQYASEDCGYYIEFEDNVTLQKNNQVMTIDACHSGKVTNKLALYGTSTNNAITITGSTANPWKATNVTFASPLDATEANTIKLTDTTFTEVAKTLNASRIQLPASTTVSFQGNTNDADTKILDASLIVVGDNPASPSGSATVVNASGASSTVSGIGTYIDKEGDNDFVANNATNVVPVDASTTGAKYLGTVLSATTGDTGANRFAKIDSGAVAVVNEATDAVNKQIITHDYEPILGGTFSLTSATVDEATKTTTILTGGTMSVVDIRGGKDSVIDLGNTRLNRIGAISGIAFKGTGDATALIGGAAANTAALSNCLFDSLVLSLRCVYLGGTTVGKCAITGTTFTNLSLAGATSSPIAIQVPSGLSLTISNCVIGENSRIRDLGGLYLTGSNAITGYTDTDASGSVTLTSGAILDLTGNTNATPIAPGGGITFEAGGATVLYGDVGSVSSMTFDNVYGSNCVISSGGVFNYKPSGDYYSPNAYPVQTITGGTVTCGASNNNYLFFNNSDRNFTLRDTTLNVAVFIVAGSTPTAGGTAALGGNLVFTNKGCIASTNTADTHYGTVVIEDNTRIDVTSMENTNVIGTGGLIGTVTVGNNVTFKNGSTVIPITAGTYADCKIAKDGTITHA